MSESLADPLMPPTVEDGAGYVITEDDLGFLGLTQVDSYNLQVRRAPLGMSPDSYNEFVRELAHALMREGISDADVRLQGSSAHFFSSWHKPLPKDKEQLFEVMCQNWPKEQDITAAHVVEASQILFSQWPPDVHRPSRRPFDSMNRCKADPLPSDYDVQICSDQMVEIVHQELQYRGLDSDQISVEDKTYAFIKKRFAENYFRYVSFWSADMTERLFRPVSWALFPSRGPLEDAEHPHLSSHFKPTDWLIDVDRMAAA